MSPEATGPQAPIATATGRQASSAVERAEVDIPAQESRPEGTATGSKTAPAEEMIDAFELRFHCLRSAIYNAARERWLDSCHRWLSFFVIVGGSGAVATIVRDDAKLALGLAAFAAFSSGVSLAFDPAGRAREHGYLRRRFYELLGEIDRKPEDQTHLADLSARLNALYGEERPHLSALNAIAWNETADALYGLEKGPRYAVRWHQSLLRNVLAFSATRFRYDDSPAARNEGGRPSSFVQET